MTGKMLRLCSVWSGLALAGVASAQLQQFDFTINSASSSVNATVAADAPFTGTILGTHTLTVPGSRTKPSSAGNFTTDPNENLPVSMSGAGHLNGGVTNTHPAGAFSLSFDATAGTAAVSGLSVDLLNGTIPSIATTGDIQWETFRTRNPTGFYVGGFPINNVPFGSSTITVFTLTQTGAATGTAVSGPPGFYAVAVTVDAIANVTLIQNGQETPLDPQAVTVAVVGTVQVSGNTASISFTQDLSQIEQTVPGPITLPEPIPFTLPVIPIFAPTACPVLMNLTLTSITAGVDGSLSIEANGVNVPVEVGGCCTGRCECITTTEATCNNAGGVFLGAGVACEAGACLSTLACACDWNNADGLDSQDYFDFLNAFFDGLADYNCTDGTDSQDYFDFIECFFGGCQ